MNDFGNDEKYLNNFSMAGGNGGDDDVEEYEEEVIINNYYDPEPDEAEEEIYEDEVYDDYDSGVVEYDDRMEKILSELTELKKNLNQSHQYAPPPYAYGAPIHQNNDMILNELSRIRDENSRQQAQLDMNAQLAKVKEDFARELSAIAERRKREDESVAKTHGTSNEVLAELSKLRQEISRIENQNAEQAQAAVHPATKGGKVSQITVKANSIGNNLSKLNTRVSEIAGLTDSAGGNVADELRAIKNDIAHLSALTSDIANSSFSRLLTATADDGSTQIINVANDELLARTKDIYSLLGNLGTKSTELNGQITDIKRVLGINALCYRDEGGTYNYRPLEDKLADLKYLAGSVTAPANVKARSMIDFGITLRELPKGHREDICNVYDALCNIIRSSPVNRADGKLLCAETGNSSKSFALDRIFELRDMLLASQDSAAYAEHIRNIADYKNKIQNNSAVDANNVVAEDIISTYDELVLADETNFDSISATLDELLNVLCTVNIGDIVRLEDYRKFRPEKPADNFGIQTQLDDIRDEITADKENNLLLLDEKFPQVLARIAEVEAKMQDFFTDPNKHYDILLEITSLRDEIAALVNPVFESSVMNDLHAVKELAENGLTPDEQQQILANVSVVNDIMAEVMSIKDRIELQASMMEDTNIVKQLTELHERLNSLDQIDEDILDVKDKLETLEKIDSDISILTGQIDQVKAEIITAMNVPNPELLAELANVRDEIFAYIDDITPQIIEQLSHVKETDNDYLEKVMSFNKSLNANLAEQIAVLQAELADLSGSVGPELSGQILAIKDEVVKLNSLMTSDMADNFRAIKEDLEVLKDNDTEIETLSELLQLRTDLTNYINREPDQTIPDEVYALREEILELTNMVAANPVLTEFSTLKEKIEDITTEKLDTIAQDLADLKEKTSGSSHEMLENLATNMTELKDKLEQNASQVLVETMAAEINEIKDKLEDFAELKDKAAGQDALDAIALDILELKESIDRFALEETSEQLKESLGALHGQTAQKTDIEAIATKLSELYDALDSVKEEGVQKTDIETVVTQLTELRESLNLLKDEGAARADIETVVTQLTELHESLNLLKDEGAARADIETVVTQLTELHESLNLLKDEGAARADIETVVTQLSELHETLNLLKDEGALKIDIETVDARLSELYDALNAAKEDGVSKADLEKLSTQAAEIKEIAEHVLLTSTSSALLIEEINGIKEKVDGLYERNLQTDFTAPLEALQANIIDQVNQTVDYSLDYLEDIQKRAEEIRKYLEELSARKTDPQLLNEIYLIQDKLSAFSEDKAQKSDKEPAEEDSGIAVRSTNLIFDELSEIKQQVLARQPGIADSKLDESMQDLKDHIDISLELLREESDSLNRHNALVERLDKLETVILERIEAVQLKTAEPAVEDETDSSETVEAVEAVEAVQEEPVLEEEFNAEQTLQAEAEDIKSIQDSLVSINERIAGLPGTVIAVLSHDVTQIKEILVSSGFNAEFVESVKRMTQTLNGLKTEDEKDNIQPHSEEPEVEAAEQENDADVYNEAYNEASAAEAETAETVNGDLAEIRMLLSEIEARQSRSVSEELEAIKAEFAAERVALQEELLTKLDSLKEELKGAEGFSSEVDEAELENDPVMIEIRAIKDEIVFQRDNQMAAQVLSEEKSQELLDTIRAIQEEAYLTKGELDPQVLSEIRELKNALQSKNDSDIEKQIRLLGETFQSNISNTAPREAVEQIVEQIAYLRDEIAALKFENEARGEAYNKASEDDEEKAQDYSVILEEIAALRAEIKPENAATLDDVLAEVNVLRQQIAEINYSGHTETDTVSESADGAGEAYKNILKYIEEIKRDISSDKEMNTTTSELARENAEHSLILSDKINESSEKIDDIILEVKALTEVIQEYISESAQDRAGAQKAHSVETVYDETVEDSENSIKTTAELVVPESLTDELAEIRLSIERIAEIQTESNSALSSMDNAALFDEIIQIKDKLNSGTPATTELLSAFDDLKILVDKISEESQKNKELFESIKEMRLSAATQGFTPEQSDAIVEMIAEVKNEIQASALKSTTETDLSEAMLEIKRDIVVNKADTDNHITIEFGAIREQLNKLIDSASGLEEDDTKNILLEEMQELKTRLSSASEEILSLKEQVGQKDNDIIQELRNELQSLKTESRFSERDEKLETLLADIMDVRQRLEEQRETYDRTLGVDIAEIKTTVADPAVKDGLDIILAEVVELKEQYSGAETVGEIKSELTELLKQGETVSDLVNDIAALKEQNSELINTVNSLKEQNSELATALTGLKEQTGLYADIIKEIREMREAENPAAVAVDMMKELQSEINELKTHTNAQIAVDMLKDLQSEISGLKTGTSAQIAVDMLKDLQSEINELKVQANAQLVSTDFNLIAELVTELREQKNQTAQPIQQYSAQVKALTDEIRQLKAEAQPETTVLLDLAEQLNNLKTNLDNNINARIERGTAAVADDVKLLQEQMTRLITTLANHQPETAQIRDIIRQELALNKIGQPQIDEGAIINEIAKLKQELSAGSETELDNSIILEELAKLKEEVSREKPNEFNRQLLEEIARIKDELTAIGNKEIAPAQSVAVSPDSQKFADSLSELKRELNQIANIVSESRMDDDFEGKYGVKTEKAAKKPAKKAEPKKPETIKPEVKKAEPKKPEAVKPETTKKAEPKKPEPAIKPVAKKADDKAKNAAATREAVRTATPEKPAEKQVKAKTEAEVKPEVKAPANKAPKPATSKAAADSKAQTVKSAKTAEKAPIKQEETVKQEAKSAAKPETKQTEKQETKPRQKLAIPYDDKDTPINELSTADLLAKQVANKLIMEQLVQQLGDGAVPQEKVDEIVENILPDVNLQDPNSDSIKRIANQLVLEKLRESLNRKK